MAHSIRYTVEKDDNLTTIARKFNVPSWKNIYNSPQNAQWKSIRQSPHNLHVGDMLIIPPNPIDLMERKIKNLELLYRQTEKGYKDLKEQHIRYKKSIDGFSFGIDLAASALTNCVTLISGSIRAMSKTGAELLKANKELAKAALIFWTKEVKNNLRNSVIKSNRILEVSEGESILTSLPKEAIDLFFNWSSPSYWAQKYTGANVDKIHRETMASISRSKTETLALLKLKIDAARSLQRELLNQRGQTEIIPALM